MSKLTRADLGEGGWGRTPPTPQQFDYLPIQREGSPFVLFWDINFWLTDPKIFLKATSIPQHTSFEDGALAKKTPFLFKKFQKCLFCAKAKKIFFWHEFKNFPAGQKNWAKRGLFRALWELGKSIWLTLKKVDKIFESDLKIQITPLSRKF